MKQSYAVLFCVFLLLLSGCTNNGQGHKVKPLKNGELVTAAGSPGDLNVSDFYHVFASGDTECQERPVCVSRIFVKMETKPKPSDTVGWSVELDFQNTKSVTSIKGGTDVFSGSGGDQFTNYSLTILNASGETNPFSYAEFNAGLKDPGDNVTLVLTILKPVGDTVSWNLTVGNVFIEPFGTGEIVR